MSVWNIYLAAKSFAGLMQYSQTVPEGSKAGEGKRQCDADCCYVQAVLGTELPAAARCLGRALEPHNKELTATQNPAVHSSTVLWSIFLESIDLIPSCEHKLLL